MIIFKVKQGTAEWKALRAQHDTASEASAMMGASRKVPRNQLLHEKATGDERQFTDWVERNVLDKGHEVEVLCRPLAAQIIGEDLFPVTGRSEEYPRMLASFDGLTMLGTTGWECKQWNEAKAEFVCSGRVPPEDFWQVVQLLVVSRANRVLYTVTKDGTPKNTVHCWLTQQDIAAHEDDLVRSWAQFNKDRAEYVPPTAEVLPADFEIVQVRPLPAINYKLNGLILTSNLDVYKEAALEKLATAKKELFTDADIKNRRELNTELRQNVDRIDGLRVQVIAEIKDVDRFVRDLEEIKETLRQAALAGEKQVEHRMTILKGEIVKSGVDGLEAHIKAINERLAPLVLPAIPADFKGAIARKSSLTIMQNAVDTELARAKIEADKLADKITANLATIKNLVADELRFLFPDEKDLVLRDAETLVLIVKQRLADHKAAEDKRLEEEREKIRQEEQQKLADEAAERMRVAREQDNLDAEDEGTAIESNKPTLTDQGVSAFLGGGAGGRIQQYGSTYRRPTESVPASAPAAATEGARFELQNIHLLITAVANARLPHRLLTVNMEAVIDYFNATGEIPAGITRTPTLQDQPAGEPCSVCFSRNCNGECMGDGLMGD